MEIKSGEKGQIGATDRAVVLDILLKTVALRLLCNKIDY